MKTFIVACSFGLNSVNICFPNRLFPVTLNRSAVLQPCDVYFSILTVLPGDYFLCSESRNIITWTKIKWMWHNSSSSFFFLASKSFDFLQSLDIKIKIIWTANLKFPIYCQQKWYGGRSSKLVLPWDCSDWFQCFAAALVHAAVHPESECVQWDWGLTDIKSVCDKSVPTDLKM